MIERCVDASESSIRVLPIDGFVSERSLFRGFDLVKQKIENKFKAKGVHATNAKSFLLKIILRIRRNEFYLILPSI